MTEPKTPKAFQAMADIVLAYRPKPKSKPGKKRKKRAAKIVREIHIRPEIRNDGHFGPAYDSSLILAAAVNRVAVSQALAASSACFRDV
jgi:hypothetical protein